MHKIRFFVFGVLCLVFSGAPLAAQSESDGAQCSERTQILDIASRILVQRHELTGFATNRFGSEAAYLILRYTNPTTESGLDMLDRIANSGTRPPRWTKELALAFAISSVGVDQGFRMAGVDRLEGFARARLDVWRAIILQDNGITFFDLMHQVRADDRLGKLFDQGFRAGIMLPQALTELDDADLVRLSKAAEAAGELQLAAEILAGSMDLTGFYALVARYPQNASVQRNQANWSLRHILHFPSPIEPAGTQTIQALSQNSYNILRASVMTGEMGFLSILFNQTGLEQEIGAVAGEFLAEVDAGTRPTSDNLQDNWLFLYDRIASRYPVEKLQRDMATFDMPSRNRHYAGSAQLTVDWMRAIRDITPYMTGAQAVLPARPQNLSEAFNWDTWVHLATGIRLGRLFAAPGTQDAQMLAELLLAAGQTEAAIQFANNQMEPSARLNFFRDLMKRIDRRCAAYSASPGQWLFRGGAVAHRF